MRGRFDEGGKEDRYLRPVLNRRIKPRMVTHLRVRRHVLQGFVGYINSVQACAGLCYAVVSWAHALHPVVSAYPRCFLTFSHI